jgi:hypothetical protein
MKNKRASPASTIARNIMRVNICEAEILEYATTNCRDAIPRITR